MKTEEDEQLNLVKMKKKISDDNMIKCNTEENF